MSLSNIIRRMYVYYLNSVSDLFMTIRYVQSHMAGMVLLLKISKMSVKCVYHQIKVSRNASNPRHRCSIYTVNYIFREIHGKLYP